VRLPTIRGSIPDPVQHIQGCRYGPRCPVVLNKCLVEAPALLPAGPARFARCPPRVTAS
jgi:ABC-type antimicrobial peptide transport system ATPase subunit